MLLQPALAAAAATEPEPPRFEVEADMSGSNDYRISIVARDHNSVTLVAKSKDETVAAYTAPGRASRSRIEADFGELGRISVRFKPFDRRDLRRGRLCGEGDIPGHFDGVISFHGEQGYTEVEASRARGTVSPRRRCIPTRDNAPPRGRRLMARAADPRAGYTVLFAVARAGERTITFEDSELSEITRAGASRPYDAFLNTIVEERRGRIEIVRFFSFSLTRQKVASPSPPGQLPVTATVRAPAPFQGTGSYLAAPGAKPTWTGDLSIPLPGAGLVPLTGPEFEVRYCNGGEGKATDACINELEDFRH